ncbi:hypothetical protein BDU57DRAFT_517241 [Ampelomyces quisqualis]|uniref:Secreted protein n=1 Tax=Ampelomyces quisqualis TaxID=50730 RepID=A0A6A5QPT0_AMPQU|nr:hypothetical protein BDU57DRAFT_517241 [Ampelomyces quisqualis]
MIMKKLEQSCCGAMHSVSMGWLKLTVILTLGATAGASHEERCKNSNPPHVAQPSLEGVTKRRSKANGATRHGNGKEGALH